MDYLRKKICSAYDIPTPILNLFNALNSDPLNISLIKENIDNVLDMSEIDADVYAFIFGSISNPSIFVYFIEEFLNKNYCKFSSADTVQKNYVLKYVQKSDRISLSLWKGKTITKQLFFNDKKIDYTKEELGCSYNVYIGNILYCDTIGLISAAIKRDDNLSMIMGYSLCAIENLITKGINYLPSLEPIRNNWNSYSKRMLRSQNEYSIGVQNMFSVCAEIFIHYDFIYGIRHLIQSLNLLMAHRLDSFYDCVSFANPIDMKASVLKMMDYLLQNYDLLDVQAEIEILLTYFGTWILKLLLDTDHTIDIYRTYCTSTCACVNATGSGNEGVNVRSCTNIFNIRIKKYSTIVIKINFYLYYHYMFNEEVLNMLFFLIKKKYIELSSETYDALLDLVFYYLNRSPASLKDGMLSFIKETFELFDPCTKFIAHIMFENTVGVNEIVDALELKYIAKIESYISAKFIVNYCLKNYNERFLSFASNIQIARYDNLGLFLKKVIALDDKSLFTHCVKQCDNASIARCALFGIESGCNCVDFILGSDANINISKIFTWSLHLRMFKLIRYLLDNYYVDNISFPYYILGGIPLDIFEKIVNMNHHAEFPQNNFSIQYKKMILLLNSGYVNISQLTNASNAIRAAKKFNKELFHRIITSNFDLKANCNICANGAKITVDTVNFIVEDGVSCAQVRDHLLNSILASNPINAVVTAIINNIEFPKKIIFLHWVWKNIKEEAIVKDIITKIYGEDIVQFLLESIAQSRSININFAALLKIYQDKLHDVCVLTRVFQCSKICCYIYEKLLFLQDGIFQDMFASDTTCECLPRENILVDIFFYCGISTVKNTNYAVNKLFETGYKIKKDSAHNKVDVYARLMSSRKSEL